MKAGFTAFLATFLCSAQPAYVEIKIPTGVRSETMFVRYALNDDLGGWVEAHPGVSSYFITLPPGAPAARFRALLYAPGCAIQTVDLSTAGTAVPRYAFVCDPLPKITLTGILPRS